MMNKTAARYILLFALTLILACTPAKIDSLRLPHPVSSVEPLTAAFTSPSTAIPAKETDILDYFMEIALGSEYGLNEFSVKKWQQDVRIQLSGYPTDGDSLAVKRVIGDLNKILAPAIHVSLVESDPNVEYHFIPQEEFDQYEPAGLIFYGGFFWAWWHPGGEIYKGRVVISSDRISQDLRNHLIREELTQLLGMMNDSERYEDSIFYQGYSETCKFAPVDRQVMQLLYSGKILPGMTDWQVRNLFRTMSLRMD